MHLFAVWGADSCEIRIQISLNPYEAGAGLEYTIPVTISKRPLVASQVVVRHDPVLPSLHWYSLITNVRVRSTVSEGDEYLSPGEDFQLAYVESQQEGMVSYTVTGIGNYVGSVSGSFEFIESLPSIPTMSGFEIFYTIDENDGLVVERVVDGVPETAIVPIENTTGNFILPAGYLSYYFVGIGDYAFDGCGFSSYSFSTVQWLGECAFRNNVNLTQVYISKTVTSVGENVFAGCTNLETIYLDGDSTLPEEVLLQGNNARIVRLGGSTTTSGVPHYWLREVVPAELQEELGGNMEEMEALLAANGKNTYAECYIAGLDPADAEARFVVSIALEGGHPVITWSPNVSGRRYTVEGIAELTNTEWQACDPENTPEGVHFFRVKVALP